MLVPSPGVGVGVRVCLARRLWAVALGSHRRAVLRKGWAIQRFLFRHTFVRTPSREQSYFELASLPARTGII